MKIVTVEVVLTAEAAVTPPFNWRAGLPGSDPSKTGGWLVLTTDDGLRGFGYTTRGEILKDLVERRLRVELVGQDPLARELLWERLWQSDRVEEFPIYIHGVVDVALWDIAGKLAGLPVHKLLGGYRTSIPAYASTVTFSTTKEYLDVVDQCLDLGYRSIKLHAWGDPRRDAKLCKELRDHVGPDIDLMYDGSAGFDLLDAIYVGKALEDAEFMYYEEPMREFSISAYKRLAERVRVPLLVAETSDGAHMSTADFISSGCAVAVRTGWHLRGGITGAMRIAHLADSFLMRAEVHAGGLPNIHLCMAIPNTTYYESIVTSNPIQRERHVDANGLVHELTASGIGFERDWEDVGMPSELRRFLDL